MWCPVYNTLPFSLPGKTQLFLLALARLRFPGPDSFTKIPANIAAWVFLVPGRC